MNVMMEERPIFENEEWLVIESGLEHKSTGYFIERESLANRRSDGLWTWPMHMAEKSWCRMAPFAEAFSCAAAVYEVQTGAELAQSFKVARREVAPWPGQDVQPSNPVPALLQTLHKERVAPILWEPRSSEKSVPDQDVQPMADEWRRLSQNGSRTGGRARPSRLTMAREAGFPWRAPRGIRKTGTKLVRLLQAAWNIR